MDELRALRCHLRAGFQQCKSLVEMCTVRCCPHGNDDDVFYLFFQKQKWDPTHCPMGTVPRVLVRRTETKAHEDFGGLSSGAAPVVVRLDVVYFPPALPRRRWRVVGWVEILLDVISGVESARREGCPRTTTGVSLRWFSGHFRQVFFNTITFTPH